jgi:hypothetical protein
VLRWLIALFALVLVTPATLLAANASRAERRVALVIGNNDYQHAKKLDNAVADAQAFRRELETRGFDVVYRENANRRTMNGAMEEFVGKLSTDAIGLIYYSGHGVQINGANYLIPTDLSAKAASDFAYDAVDLTKLVDRVSQTQAKFALAVIDACRDNPFQGTGRDIGGSRGLVAPSGNASGVMVVYSAGANQKALDRLSDADRNPNGLFTREFLKAMRIPGLTVQEAVNQIKMSVIAQAKSVGHLQTPAIYDQSVGTFVFTPGAPPTPAPVETVSNSAEATRLRAELAAARAETERLKSQAASAELGRLRAEQERKLADAVRPEPIKTVPVVPVVSERKNNPGTVQQLRVSDGQKQFSIDALPVNGRDFSKCVDARACEKPPNDQFNREAEYSAEPAMSVSWFNAKAYCAFAGKRLPSLGEYQAAYPKLGFPGCCARGAIPSEWTSEADGVAKSEGTQIRKEGSKLTVFKRARARAVDSSTVRCASD